MHGHPVESSPASMAARDLSDAGSHRDDGDASLAGLCLAVLAIALLGLFWLGRSARWRWVGGGVTGRRAVVWPAVIRDRDPPDLFALSIQRC